MTNAHAPSLPDEQPPQEMTWLEISEPGSYLHVESGLIARIHPEELAGHRVLQRGIGVGTVVLLLPNPNAPIQVLRQIAQRHGYRVVS